MKAFNNNEIWIMYNNLKNLSSPRIEDLPSIKIEIELSLDDQPINQKFCGLNYDLLPKSKANEMKYGIQFVFEFDKEYEPDFNEIDFSMKENHAIPIEYYNATWTTFAGRTYHRIMNPLSSILIDSSINTRDIYGNYARTLYNTALEENDRRISVICFYRCFTASIINAK